MPLRVSLVNLQKFTFQAWLLTPSMKMLAPEQKTLSFSARHDDRAHLGMLEADAVERVVQLDVDAQVVAVELQLVAGAQAGVLVDVERQRGQRAVEARASSGGSAAGSVW